MFTDPMMQATLDEKFSSIRNDKEMFERLMLEPGMVLESAGIPVIKDEGVLKEMLEARPQPSNMMREAIMAEAQPLEQPASEHIEVESHWWGVDIIMNEKLTQDILDGTIAAGSLAELITGGFLAASLLTGPMAAVFGVAFGAAFIAKTLEIKVVDNGQGVHWPITWLQWGPLFVSAAGGPTAMTAAILVFIHPLRN